MNLITENIMEPQQENNRLTTVTSLEHCIFNWKICDASLCFVCEKAFYRSSTFDLTDGSKWNLSLNIRVKNNDCIFYTRLCRDWDEINLERIKVRFSLTLQYPNGSPLWSFKNCVFTFMEGDRSGDVFKINASTVLDLINEAKYDDTLVIVCEMIAVVVTNEIWRGGINFHLDIRVLSENFTKLLEDKLMTNIVLLVEGNQEIKAHKEILSIWSNKFAELLEGHERWLEIPFYTYEVVKAMLTFLYSGDVNVLTINDPPPIELCECAEHYGIAGLSNLLQPREIVQETTIRSGHHSYSWDIMYFHNVIGGSVREGFLRDSQVKLNPDSEPDGKVTFRIEVSNVNPGCVIVNDITIFDRFYNKRLTGRHVNVDWHSQENCTFKVSLDFSGNTDIRRQFDVLAIQCDFKYKLRRTRYEPGPTLLVKDFDSDGYNWDILSKQMSGLFWSFRHTDTEVGVVHPDGLFSRPAHKSVLSARSPVFQAVLACPNGQIFLRCCSSTAKEFLHYMYTGTLRECRATTLMDLHNFACRFWIYVLKEKCFRLLHNRVDRFTACRICSFADHYRYENLKRLCFECIFHNRNEISGTFRWNEMCRNRALEEEITTYITNRI